MVNLVTRYLSPLRYPGGKAAIAPFLEKVIRLNHLEKCPYYEPFAGGAGAALTLLKNGTVSRVYLNDADIRVYSIWRSILSSHEKFIESIDTAELSIENWKRQLEICLHPRSYTQFEVGFATFFLNRCNRSGIILGSRPIGGMEQRGAFDLSARFNKKGLTNRIQNLVGYKDAIQLENRDAIEFLKQCVPSGRSRSNVFVYLDPPYFGKGKRLYLNYYTAEGHKRLAQYIQRHQRLRWLMSYDNHPEVRRLYGSFIRGRIPVEYSLSTRRVSNELLIAPAHVNLGHSRRVRKC